MLSIGFLTFVSPEASVFTGEAVRCLLAKGTDTLLSVGPVCVLLGDSVVPLSLHVRAGVMKLKVLEEVLRGAGTGEPFFWLLVSTDTFRGMDNDSPCCCAVVSMLEADSIT